MKTKETTRQAKSGAAETLFPAMKETDMTGIERKIHDLLIAEGYQITGAGRFEGIALNNFTKVDRMEYRRGERERVTVTTNSPGQKKTKGEK
jgi:hypothetical protein